MTYHIDSIRDFRFISDTFSAISANQWNRGSDLPSKIRLKRKELRAAARAFESTTYMPCGYQDAAGDRCERIGSEYMVLVHAYLACRYGQLTKRLSVLVENTLVSVPSEANGVSSDRSTS